MEKQALCQLFQEHVGRPPASVWEAANWGYDMGIIDGDEFDLATSDGD